MYSTAWAMSRLRASAQALKESRLHIPRSMHERSRPGIEDHASTSRRYEESCQLETRRLCRPDAPRASFVPAFTFEFQ
jgi:hypothetical protein